MDDYIINDIIKTNKCTLLTVNVNLLTFKACMLA